MEAEGGLDASAAIADMRFSFIFHVCDACVTKPRQSKERDRSEAIDRVLTGRWTAIPMFILIMGLVFHLTFNVVVWFLSHFDLRLNLVNDEELSILATVASGFAPLFRPIGLGDWRIITSLISGFMAKESVVSVMQELFAGAGGVAGALSSLGAASMLVFSLLYTPCVAAIAAIKRELGGSRALSVAVFQCAVASADYVVL